MVSSVKQCRQKAHKIAPGWLDRGRLWFNVSGKTKELIRHLKQALPEITTREVSKAEVSLDRESKGTFA